MIKHTLSTLLVFTLSACATHQMPGKPASGNEAETEENIHYPAPDTQTQIDQLGIQVSRLEQQIQSLQTRIKQLERKDTPRAATVTAKPRRQPSVSSISADEAVINQRIQQNASQTLRHAQSQYNNGNYKAAIATLRHAESGGNGNDTARRSMYLLMQSHQRLNNCESVINIGNRFIGRFRDSREAPETLFIIGQCQHAMQQRDIAKTTWHKLIQTYPDSSAAKRAYQQLKKK